MASETQPKRQDTIFFFGAGASVDAEIPDTYAFVDEFEAHLEREHPAQLPLFSNIMKTLRGQYEKNVDIEKLIECLQLLKERHSNLLVKFYEGANCSLNYNYDQIQELIRILQNFLREKVIIKDESKLEYLKELLNFDTPLEIYSTNYDTCIEQLSHMTYRRYTDGLDVYWNPENFDKEFDIKHFKLHGSVIWFENVKSKECVKIPIQSFSSGKPLDLRLIYGETVEPLLIYPAQKAEYLEPCN